MSKQKEPKDLQQGVVSLVFESFITALRNDTSLDPAIAERLNTALIKSQELSAEALRRVLFFEEPLT